MKIQDCLIIPKRMSGSFLDTLRYDPKYERSELVHSVGGWSQA